MGVGLRGRLGPPAARNASNIGGELAPIRLRLREDFTVQDWTWRAGTAPTDSVKVSNCHGPTHHAKPVNWPRMWARYQPARSWQTCHLLDLAQFDFHDEGRLSPTFSTSFPFLPPGHTQVNIISQSPKDFETTEKNGRGVTLLNFRRLFSRRKDRGKVIKVHSSRTVSGNNCWCDKLCCCRSCLSLPCGVFTSSSFRSRYKCRRLTSVSFLSRRTHLSLGSEWALQKIYGT